MVEGSDLQRTEQAMPKRLEKAREEGQIARSQELTAFTFLLAAAAAILLVTNFTVIARGGGRIAEESACFTLDAMPGKQMAINADLNAGLTGEDKARKSRTAISQQAGFYGSMDGARKFARGDAIAGILIILITISRRSKP